MRAARFARALALVGAAGLGACAALDGIDSPTGRGGDVDGGEVAGDDVGLAEAASSDVRAEREASTALDADGAPESSPGLDAAASPDASPFLDASDSTDTSQPASGVCCNAPTASTTCEIPWICCFDGPECRNAAYNNQCPDVCPAGNSCQWEGPQNTVYAGTAGACP